MHLTPNGCVASLFKLLTYYRVCCAFSSARALSLNAIYVFEMACYYFLLNINLLKNFHETFSPRPLKNVQFYSRSRKAKI